MQLAEVQQQQNELKKTELMINVALTQKERELKAHLSELWRNLKRELQQNEFNSRQDLQVRQIQADWDKIKLPNIFSRQELENLAQDCDRPLYQDASYSGFHFAVGKMKTAIPLALALWNQLLIRLVVGSRFLALSAIYAALL